VLVSCFKCDKPIVAAASRTDAWDAPRKAVRFEGGWTEGSELYDALNKGVYCQIVVCDKCLEEGYKEGLLRNLPAITIELNDDGT
jgi:hypothetical protein